jgi:hypothetical protein
MMRRRIQALLSFPDSFMLSAVGFGRLRVVSFFLFSKCACAVLAVLTGHISSMQGKDPTEVLLSQF